MSEEVRVFTKVEQMGLMGHQTTIRFGGDPEATHVRVPVDMYVELLWAAGYQEQTDGQASDQRG